MLSERAAELTERIRHSKFGREVIAPKVAQPLATWLDDNFGEDDDDAQRVEAAAPEEPTEPEVIEDVDAEEDDGTEEEEGSRLQRLKYVVDEVKTRIKDHNLVVVAAGIAFWGLLAIPALLFATISIAGLVLDSATVKDEVNENLDGLPEEARTIIGEQLENVSAGSTGGLITGLVVGILLALWTTSGAMAKMMSTLNLIYGTQETRKFLELRGTAVLLTFGGIVFVSGAVFLLALLPIVLNEIEGVGDSASLVLNFLRFPALGAVMVICLGLLYHLGPDHRGRYRVFTVGALTATVLWLCLSALFTIYTATAGSYNETYGSLGGLVILLLWLFITAFVVLIGAEVHALTGKDPPHADDARSG